MDIKRLVLVISLSFLMVMGWTYLSLWFQSKHPEWYKQKAPTAQTQPTTEPGAATTQVAATQPQQAGGLSAQGADVAESAKLGLFAYDGKHEGKYSIGVALAARGASVDEVSLNWYREVVGKNTPYVFQKPYDVGPENRRFSLATEGITVDGKWVDLFYKDWKLESSSEGSAVYSVRVKTPSGAILVRKRFELRPSKSPSLGFEVGVTHDFVNEGNAAAKIQLYLNGPTSPHVENNRDLAEVVSGHLKDGYILIDNKYGSSYKPDDPPTRVETKQGPTQWAGIVSTYFDALVRPVLKKGENSGLSSVEIQSLAKPADDGQIYVNLQFAASAVTVGAGQTASVPMEVYFGPRHREVLNTDYYSNLGFNKTLVLPSGFCGFCTFQWLVDGLVFLLDKFHLIFRDWGLSIIALVCLVRLVLHPITKKSQVMMAKMGKMGPEMEKLKKKYGDDKEELQRQMVGLYKEQGFTPVLGCLPMFLQMPIWIALWSALQSTFELRHAPFLWGWTYIHDLAQPDRLISLPKMHILFFTLDAVNLLPILMAGVFWIQQKVTPKPPVTDPQQAQQQKMMQWMTLLFPLMLYTGPSGLNLYILASTTIGIFESRIVRKHIQEQDEAEKAGRVIVDAKVQRSTRKVATPAKEAKKGGLAGWMEKLQKMAEDAQKQADKKGRKR